MRVLEPRWLELNAQNVAINKPTLKKPIRLMHLSDFHFSDYVSLDFIDYAFQQALQQQPDVICITGDFISWDREDDPGYIKLLQKYSPRVPLVACLGNHDGGSWAGPRGGPSSSKPMKDLLEKGGVQVLHNQKETLRLQQGELDLIGLGNNWAKEMRPRQVYHGEQDPDRIRILLSHNPDTKTALHKYDWDIMLSGHTHGGQLRLPIVGTPFAPVKDLRYVEGLHRWRDRYLHISKGVGNLHGLRFNCRPEISLLHIG